MMNITQDQINSMLRAILVLAGTYLFGHNIFGNVIDSSIWQEISGAVMIAASFIWSAFTKSLTIEIFQSSILKILMVLGALLVTSGKLSSEKLEAITAVLTAALPVFYSMLSKKKSTNIITGKTSTDKLST